MRRLRIETGYADDVQPLDPTSPAAALSMGRENAIRVAAQGSAPIEYVPAFVLTRRIAGEAALVTK
ncbi:hypothetical protein LTR53_009487 [Teratosphaeriaceae sp. CCFEE 6253]|nr:hypothetical protein LTR53_009487 [Teratosphaeriaceae sp. CCFEE 6253]